MNSKEPQISADGMSNDELLAWMKNKTKAVEALKSALAHKEFLEEQLQINAAEIESLTPQACLNIL